MMASVLATHVNPPRRDRPTSGQNLETRSIKVKRIRRAYLQRFLRRRVLSRGGSRASPPQNCNHPPKRVASLPPLSGKSIFSSFSGYRASSRPESELPIRPRTARRSPSPSVHDLAAELLLRGDMRHRCRRRRAMPVLLTRRKPHHIPGPDFLHRPAVALHRPKPVSTISVCPSGWVCPRRPRARLKRHRRRRRPPRLIRLKQRVDPHRPRKPIRRPPHRRLRSISRDFHDGNLLHAGPVVACSSVAKPSRFGTRMKIHVARRHKQNHHRIRYDRPR